MSDRELLELAAKAAGRDFRWDSGVLILLDPMPSECSAWNPLTDDGDALRLAVKLSIHVGLQSAEAWRNGNEVARSFDDGNDHYAATRRAIVNVAAEIGKTMP